MLTEVINLTTTGLFIPGMITIRTINVLNNHSKSMRTQRNDIVGIVFKMIFFQLMNCKNIDSQAESIRLYGLLTPRTITVKLTTMLTIHP